MLTFILFAVCFVIAFVAMVISDWIGIAKFREVYPPISDEEFLRRLSPEVPPEIGLKVRELLCECMGIPENQIYPEVGLLELTGESPPRFKATPPIDDIRPAARAAEASSLGC